MELEIKWKNVWREENIALSLHIVLSSSQMTLKEEWLILEAENVMKYPWKVWKLDGYSDCYK